MNRRFFGACFSFFARKKELKLQQPFSYFCNSPMVLGVGILMNVISLSGGIDIMVDGLESVMGPKTAATIMAIAAGLMSFFSSGLGVVFPTLIPTASGLAASIGGVTV